MTVIDFALALVTMALLTIENGTATVSETTTRLAIETASVGIAVHTMVEIHSLRAVITTTTAIAVTLTVSAVVPAFEVAMTPAPLIDAAAETAISTAGAATGHARARVRALPADAMDVTIVTVETVETVATGQIDARPIAPAAVPARRSQTRTSEIGGPSLSSSWPIVCERRSLRNFSKTTPVPSTRHRL